ncbi:MAG: diphthine synthase, partial [Candidatus Woesearchaeota archaeon]
TSMPFFDKSWKPGTAYEVIAENQKNGLHTLILLDIKVAEPSSEALLKGDMTPAPARFMTAGKCLKQLRELEGIHKKGIITDKTYCVCCARVGQPDMVIKYGLIKDLVSYDLGKPLHCIIIPGSLHFVEEEMLRGFL